MAKRNTTDPLDASRFRVGICAEILQLGHSKSDQSYSKGQLREQELLADLYYVSRLPVAQTKSGLTANKSSFLVDIQRLNDLARVNTVCESSAPP